MHSMVIICLKAVKRMIFSVITTKKEMIIMWHDAGVS